MVLSSSLLEFVNVTLSFQISVDLEIISYVFKLSLYKHYFIQFIFV